MAPSFLGTPAFRPELRLDDPTTLKGNHVDVRCVICDELYPHVYPDSLEICATCFDKNFAGAQPPPDSAAHVPAGPEARAVLDAFLDSPHGMTPRQRSAMARLAAAWHRQEAEETP